MLCFCGCGKQTGFWEANSYGKTAALLLKKLQDMAPDGEDWQAFIDDGREWYERYASVTHRELPLQSISTQAWKRWRDLAYTAVKEADSTSVQLG